MATETIGDTLARVQADWDTWHEASSFGAARLLHAQEAAFLRQQAEVLEPPPF